MRKEGISLITLIITIIVIIILASIVIFTGLNTPDRAGFAKFVSEIEDVQTYVTNAIANEKGNNIIKGTVKSDAQLAYMIATGTSASNVPASPTATGTVASLGKTILPSSLQGTKYYEITNTDVWSLGKTYYGSDEKHYITDKGEVSIWPGYPVADEETEKWYVNQNKYYIGSAGLSDPSNLSDLDKMKAFFENHTFAERLTYDSDGDMYWFPCQNGIEPITDAGSSIVFVTDYFDDYYLVVYKDKCYEIYFDDSNEERFSEVRESSYTLTYNCDTEEYPSQLFLRETLEGISLEGRPIFFDNAYLMIDGVKTNLNAYVYEDYKDGFNYNYVDLSAVESAYNLTNTEDNQFILEKNGTEYTIELDFLVYW